MSPPASAVPPSGDAKATAIAASLAIVRLAKPFDKEKNEERCRKEAKLIGEMVKLMLAGGQ